jgi:nucleotide-binding universal stress UspA family protein
MAMLRSVVVALDDTASSKAAQRFAIALAKSFSCDVTGLTILDRSYITAPTATGIGGLAYKDHRDQVKLKEAQAFISRLEEGFGKDCTDLGIKWQVVEEEGDPLELIQLESRRHDLVVIGKDTDFHIDDQPTVADVVEHLLRTTPRPIIVCPEKLLESGVILATADGSENAARAIHMLALLDIARDQVVHVLSVNAQREDAELHAQYAADFLVKHGIQVKTHAVESDMAPSTVILEQAEALGAAMVVIGASGRRSWHDFFVGSTATQMLESSPCPLFVYH